MGDVKAALGPHPPTAVEQAGGADGREVHAVTAPRVFLYLLMQLFNEWMDARSRP